MSKHDALTVACLLQWVDVDSVAALDAELAKHDTSKRVFILFFGKKDAEGISWCSDCVKGGLLASEGAGRRDRALPRTVAESSSLARQL